MSRLSAGTSHYNRAMVLIFWTLVRGTVPAGRSTSKMCRRGVSGRTAVLAHRLGLKSEEIEPPVPSTVDTEDVHLG